MSSRPLVDMDGREVTAVHVFMSFFRSIQHNVTSGLRFVTLRVNPEGVRGRFVYEHDPGDLERELVWDVECLMVTDLLVDVRLILESSCDEAVAVDDDESLVYLRNEPGFAVDQTARGPSRIVAQAGPGQRSPVDLGEELRIGAMLAFFAALRGTVVPGLRLATLVPGAVTITGRFVYEDEPGEFEHALAIEVGERMKERLGRDVAITFDVGSSGVAGPRVRPGEYQMFVRYEPVESSDAEVRTATE